jgi:hypothetical protein
MKPTIIQSPRGALVFAFPEKIFIIIIPYFSQSLKKQLILKRHHANYPTKVKQEFLITLTTAPSWGSALLTIV